MKLPPITLAQALLYEVSSSWWTSRIHSERLKDIAARYFAWKVRRKYKRYEWSMTIADKIKRQYDL